MITTMIILSALMLGVALAIIFDALSTERKLKEAECRLKEVEAERNACKAANKAYLADVSELNLFKISAMYISKSDKYVIKPYVAGNKYTVVRLFTLSDNYTYPVSIKSFYYNPEDESDRLHALSEAEELLDTLNDKVSWRISKDNGAIREDSRPSEEGETEQ